MRQILHLSPLEKKDPAFFKARVDRWSNFNTHFCLLTKERTTISRVESCAQVFFFC